MTNVMAQLNNTLTMWEDNAQLEEIRKIFAPTLTDTEFKIFVGMGKATGLNPFLKEMWAVKYGKDREGNELPAQIFIGRDGYRKGAHANPNYDYHQVDAVYENDTYEVTNGEVRHIYNLKNRGKLIGAYCLVKLKDSSKPHYTFAELEEYSTGQSLWAEISYKDNKYGGKYKTGGKPATMIKKVAEAQGLRMASDIFQGTYSEYEINPQMENNNGRVIQGETQTERLKNLLNIKKEDCIFSSEENNCPDSVVLDSTGEIINPYLKPYNPTNIPISPEYLNKIEILMKEEAFDEERREKALKHFKVKKFSDLTEKDAKDFLMQFGRI